MSFLLGCNGNVPPAAPRIRAVGSIFGGTTQATIAIPGGAKDGDLLILFVETANQAPATPSGWTALTPFGTGTAGATTATSLATFYKTYVAASDVSVFLSASVDHFAGVIIAIRPSQKGIAPVLQYFTGNTATSSTSVVITGGTTTVANTLIVDACSHGTDNTPSNQFSAQANTGLSSLKKIFDSGSISGNGGGIGIFTGSKQNVGALADTTATLATASAKAYVRLGVHY